MKSGTNQCIFRFIELALKTKIIFQMLIFTINSELRVLYYIIILRYYAKEGDEECRSWGRDDEEI